MTNFEDLGLNEAVLRGITREGFSTPTPIQASLIPEVMKGRDCVGLSQTGSGKTAAFVLPILHELAEEEQKAGPKHCRALIVAPTRELAMQIMDNARAMAKYTDAKIALLIGGTAYGSQIKNMERGADLVVATPGRLIDHIESGYLALHRTTKIVLDEADQMMDMGFMPAIRKIMQIMPEKRQTVLLSATMPKQIRKLASDFLKKPFETEVTPQSKPVERIEQHVYSIKARDRRRSLLALLQDETVERAIVFTRTKRTADDVENLLARSGIKTFALHGDKSKGERNRALGSFKTGKISVLVATDIAARGIDVDDVSHVVNYEMPNVPEAYVHRVGRTGRAGKEGIAWSLCAPTEQKNLREIQVLTGLKLPMEQLNIRDVEMPDKDAIAVQPEVEAPRGGRGQGGRNGQRGNREDYRGDRKSFGDRKPREDRDGEQRGERRSFDRKPREDRDGEQRGERRSFDRKPREDRDGEQRGERRSFDRKPREDRDGEQRGERKSFGDRKPREYRDGEQRGERKSFGDRKPRGQRDGDFRGKPEGGFKKSFGDRKPRRDFKDDDRRDMPRGKRDPNAPVWNPIRGKAEDPLTGELIEVRSEDRGPRPKKKGGARKTPKPGNHRKGQDRQASASGKPRGQGRDGDKNKVRPARAPQSKAQGSSEAAA